MDELPPTGLNQVTLFDPSEIRVENRFRKDLGDLEDLKQSIRELGLLQPIGVSKDKRLVFGERRLKACIELGVEKVPAYIVDGDLYHQKLAELHENIKRKNVSWQEEVLALEEIKQVYENLYGWKDPKGGRPKNFSSDEKFSQPKLANDLHISEGKISQDLQLAYAVKKYPDVANAKTKREALRKLRQKKKVEEKEGESRGDFVYDAELRNLWFFHECDERFGIAGYPGRMPGQVVVNLLHYFTDPGMVVVDPFAGSGTTIDVCNAMRRKCISFDLNPVRNDIIQNDAGKGVPLGSEAADFVLLDPPYSMMKKGEYTDNPNDLSNMGLEEYFDAVRKVVEESKRILRNGGYLAFIISSLRRNGAFHDLPFKCYAIVLESGFVPVERIIVPYSGNEASADGGYWNEKARQGRFMLRGYRDLMVFRKEAPAHA